MPTLTPSFLPNNRLLHVLIVDDMPQVRYDLRLLFELTGAIVVVGEAVNGMDAIRQAEDLHPDVVVMDLEMPLMDGCEAARLIKERGLAKRVIILTIHNRNEVEKRIQAAGVDAYVQKGAGYEVLIGAILQAN